MLLHRKLLESSLSWYGFPFLLYKTGLRTTDPEERGRNEKDPPAVPSS